MVGSTAELDVVVVGAGAAGCVLAARLSQDPGCPVLPLEAGEPLEGEASSAPTSVIGLRSPAAALATAS